MKRCVPIFLAAMMFGCTAVNQGENTERSFKLNFKNCTPELGLASIKLSLDRSYRKDEITDIHGYCEYRFFHPSGLIIYFSSNVYSGSTLNLKNRLDVNIDTYSNNRSVSDTVRNSGQENDGTYWMEWVRGNFVAGFINCVDTTAATKILTDIEVESTN